MTTPSPAVTAPEERPTPGTGRILGVDLARALAIVGMLAVHVGPTRAEGLAGWLYALPHGRASVLFVLVAGIGVSLLDRSRRATFAGSVRSLLWRALLLLPIGLALQELDHRVFVILQTYAVLFLVAVPFLRLPDGPLFASAAVVALLGPIGYLVGVTYEPAIFDRNAVALSDAPRVIVHRLVLSGPYPVIVWAAPFLAGMWIGRRDLRSTRVRLALLLGGAAVLLLVHGSAALLAEAVASPSLAGAWLLLDATPHSQMPAWLLGSTAAATLVVGASLMLADAAPRVVWPVVAMGQLALTVYVAHLLALHAWSDVLRSREVGRASLVVAGFTFTAAAASAAWRSRLRRGPLESLLRPPGAGGGGAAG